MSNAVIVSGVRTAVGAFGGALKDIPAKDLGALVIHEVLSKAGFKPALPANAKDDAPDTAKDEGLCSIEQQYSKWADNLKEIAVDEVIIGNVIGAGQGQNVGRQAMIRAGLPKETTAYTINKVCASGMKAIALAAAGIKAGDNEVVIAGGMENMSDVPIGLPKARWGHRMDMPFGKTVDLMVFDALYEIFYGYHMGITAENIAARYGISREEQDKLSLESHTRARNAMKNGILKDEIVPVIIPQKKGNPIVFDTDERPMDTSMEKLAKLNTAFKKDGTVTAGNAYMGLGPVPAVRKLLRVTGTSIKDYGLFELNEAFAAQAIACLRELNIPWDITNVNGSAISIGHPVGCSGARIVLALANEMKRRNVSLGLASLCIGGGQGMAIAIEAV
ncbi:MAG: acetyl-CoA acetyltransferase [Deltaproteobacteria bacterium]|nr:acetyl-CoA acetyltransferase [Deltaproteobacteria bacterium]